MGLIRNKKGVVFTILAIILTIFFTTIFSARIERPIDSKVDVIEARVNILNTYMDDFFSYAEGAGSMTGYAALRGVIQDLAATRRYNSNFEAQYVNCTIFGNLTSTKACPGMVNQTLGYFLNSFNATGKDELNIASKYKVNSVKVNQTTDSFSIELIMNISFNITDDYANLSDTRVVVSSVTIAGLLDPLHLLNATYNRTIVKNTLNKKEGDWNYTDLQYLYYNRTYRSYKEGPSFIDRIKGQFPPAFPPSMYGIESIVNYTDPGVNYNANDTMVDYLYWRNIRFKCRNPIGIGVEIVAISNTAILPQKGSQYFQLDEEHRLSFNITSSDTAFTCSQT